MIIWGIWYTYSGGHYKVTSKVWQRGVCDFDLEVFKVHIVTK